MKSVALIGVMLIALGLLALAYQAVSYTTREKVLDLGPLEATRETRRTIPLPPIVGVTAVAAGVILLVTVSRRKK